MIIMLKILNIYFYNIIMIPILILTKICISACSILNVMKITNLYFKYNLQSYVVKPCAVAING